jgi:polysaccharide deacetylase family protein (PEP-CTERM system associated)
MATRTETVTNALSFDLEHWYMATLVRDSVTNPTDRIESSVERVLELLNNHDVTATFFVVGEVAEEYPDLVARVADEGHELATHGHTHTPLFQLDRDSFAHELSRSTNAIRKASGVDVTGFRAPNFSITPETEWAFETLSGQGFRYDASVFPAWTPMYGIRSAPKKPYCVDNDSPFTESSTDSCCNCGEKLLEVPAAVHPRWNIPVSGGFYARFLPLRVIKWGIDALNEQGHPAVLYFHPWEFNPGVKVSTLPFQIRFVSYYRITQTGDVLRSLLKDYQFDSVANVIGPQRTEKVVGTRESE